MNYVFRAVQRHLGSLSSCFINHAETAYSPDVLSLCKKETGCCKKSSSIIVLLKLLRPLQHFIILLGLKLALLRPFINISLAIALWR